MKILLTNDDGIDALGLKALEESVRGDIYIAAPAVEMSECSHTVTTKEPIRVEQRGANRFAVYGSPADCVRLGLCELFQDVSFDWVLSGINQGGNLGADVFMSGTVAAAREAVLLGHRAAAVSHYTVKGRELDWALASARFTRVFKQLREQALVAHHFWNVNLPHPNSDDQEPTLTFPSLDKNPLPVQYSKTGENQYQYSGVYPRRNRETGTDVDLCFAGQITATPVALFL